MTEFGKILRIYRIDKGMRLYDMARDLKISSAMLSSIETGKKPVPDRIVLDIIRIYKFDHSMENSILDAVMIIKMSYEIFLKRDATKIQRTVACLISGYFEKLTEEDLKAINLIIINSWNLNKKK